MMPMPASPSSLPGGAITPHGGGGQRQKAMTIATSLNIDGRQLASMLSEHIISMMSDPDSAPAADWQSMPHGPDSQFSAAWGLAVRTALLGV
jgi:hypothetical protein